MVLAGHWKPATTGVTTLKYVGAGGANSVAVRASALAVVLSVHIRRMAARTHLLGP